MGFRSCGLGFRVWDLGLGVKGLWCRVLLVEGLGVQGLGVHSSGLGIGDVVFLHKPRV